ncbi:hypothetical protein G6F56_005867 [Rhizopus delemar]|nr:hypothetical protein G6F56_005867 [Rhizopus delemar]
MNSNTASNNNHAIVNASNNNNSISTATGAEIISSSGRGRGRAPITGRDQHLPQMWDRIHENFAREIGWTTPSSGSLMNRYSVINKEVTFFNAQVAHMVNENRSGYNEIDNLRKLYLREARILYVKAKNDTFSHPTRIEQQLREIGAENNGGQGESSSALPRPIGRKKAKENVEKFNQKRKLQQTIKQFVDIFSKRQKAQEVSDEDFKLYHDFEIITTNTTSLEDERRRYFLVLLKEEAFGCMSERRNARAQQQLKSAAPSSVNEESDS